MCDAESPLIGIGQISTPFKVVFNDAEFLKHVATDVHALVATGAANALEQPVAREFKVTQGGGVSAQEQVKA